LTVKLAEFPCFIFAGLIFKRNKSKFSKRTVISEVTMSIHLKRDETFW